MSKKQTAQDLKTIEQQTRFHEDITTPSKPQQTTPSKLRRSPRHHNVRRSPRLKELAMNNPSLRWTSPPTTLTHAIVETTLPPSTATTKTSNTQYSIPQRDQETTSIQQRIESDSTEIREHEAYLESLRMQEIEIRHRQKQRQEAYKRQQQQHQMTLQRQHQQHQLELKSQQEQLRLQHQQEQQQQQQRLQQTAAATTTTTRTTSIAATATTTTTGNLLADRWTINRDNLSWITTPRYHPSCSTSIERPTGCRFDKHQQSRTINQSTIQRITNPRSTWRHATESTNDQHTRRESPSRFECNHPHGKQYPIIPPKPTSPSPSRNPIPATGRRKNNKPW